MNVEARGLALIKSFESCRLSAYRDQRGVLTIGWGHTGPDVAEGLVWTQEQADAALEADLQIAVGAVNRSVRVALNQNQFDALVSFVFNVGAAAFAASTLLRLLNGGYPNLAATQFPDWDNVDGVQNPGLLRRRDAEQQLFEEAV